MEHVQMNEQAALGLPAWETPELTQADVAEVTLSGGVGQSDNIINGTFS